MDDLLSTLAPAPTCRRPAWPCLMGALVAGGVGAIIGSGGWVDFILAVAPGMPAQVALGTNKLTAIGTAAAYA